MPAGKPDKACSSLFHDTEVIENPVKLQIGAKIAPPAFDLQARTRKGRRSRVVHELLVAARANTPAPP
jgi:hypothetical protein